MTNEDNTTPPKQPNSLTLRFEKAFLYSRWLLAPFYVGVLAALAMLMIKFMQELVALQDRLFSLSEKDVIVEVLSLVDIALVGNLMVMVAFVGYHQFISSLTNAIEAHEKPSWLTSSDYHGLKLKAMGSIAVICAIELLRIFLNIEESDERQIALQVIILLAIALTGFLLAWMDRLAKNAHDD